jgi:hypothetical protein
MYLQAMLWFPCVRCVCGRTGNTCPDSTCPEYFSCSWSLNSFFACTRRKREVRFPSYVWPHSTENYEGRWMIVRFAHSCDGRGVSSLVPHHPSLVPYSITSLMTPAPTVLPPSRMAKRRPWSIAIGVINSTLHVILSPGITISTPSASFTTPVTSVVRK